MTAYLTVAIFSLMIVTLLSFCHLCICPTVTLGGAVLEILDQGRAALFGGIVHGVCVHP